MNIIPAIDIKDGKVVKAKQGDRDRYHPIDKDSGFSSDPFKFIKEMTKVYRPSIFYIADINSLISENHNIDLIKDIASMNKNIHFWVDIGGKIDQRLAKRNIEPILCSENCLSIKNINYIYKNYIHSYDYKNKLLGLDSFKNFDSSYKNKIIFMNIADVGNDKGPDYKYIRSMNKKSSIQYYVGGGIKSTFDINKLETMGFSGVLVSSLLFKNYKNSFLIKKRAGK
jgi:phosphoribosylformimino-5-aminoimidazole carboxamide ribotide isomerase